MSGARGMSEPLVTCPVQVYHMPYFCLTQAPHMCIRYASVAVCGNSLLIGRESGPGTSNHHFPSISVVLWKRD